MPNCYCINRCCGCPGCLPKVCLCDIYRQRNNLEFEIVPYGNSSSCVDDNSVPCINNICLPPKPTYLCAKCTVCNCSSYYPTSCCCSQSKSPCSCNQSNKKVCCIKTNNGDSVSSQVCKCNINKSKEDVNNDETNDLGESSESLGGGDDKKENELGDTKYDGIIDNKKLDNKDAQQKSKRFDVVKAQENINKQNDNVKMEGDTKYAANTELDNKNAQQKLNKYNGVNAQENSNNQNENVKMEG